MIYRTVQKTNIFWTNSGYSSRSHHSRGIVHQLELDNLVSKNKLRTTLVKQLRLFLDEQRHIQCRGRIHKALMSESTKFPILLPTNHLFTKVVVLSIHHQLLSALIRHSQQYDKDSGSREQDNSWENPYENESRVESTAEKSTPSQIPSLT